MEVTALKGDDPLPRGGRLKVEGTIEVRSLLPGSLDPEKGSIGFASCGASVAAREI